MNTVSFETAKALRDAGFPQPKPAEEQFWYNPDFGIFIVGRRSFIDGKMRNIFYFEMGKKYNKFIDSFDICFFAPTATDILEQLGHIYVLWFDDSPKMRKWYCCETTPVFSDEHRKPFEGETSHEAAAQAYLQLHKPA